MTNTDKQVYNFERVAFEPFADVSGVLSGAPFKIFPTGTWYRGERVLNVTADRLKEFAANIKSGLPRFNIPINLNHDDSSGKVGTVFDAEYLPAGPKGDGLYATRYELTDKGKRAVTDDGYDAVSGEAVWTLFDNSKYQDPQTGAMIDNVLTGVALCTKPFFGHSSVALFSADQQEADNMAVDAPQNLAGMINGIKSMLQKMMGMLEQDASADSAEPETAVAETKPSEKLSAVGLDTKPETKGVKIMDSEIVTPTPTAEAFSVKAEEFAALQAKAAKVEKLEADMQEATKRAEKFEADLMASNRAHRLDQLKAHADQFTALPVQANDLAAKLQALEEKDPDLFKYFDELLGTVNSTVAAGDLFAQKSSALAGKPGGESFTDKVQAKLIEKFSGDQSKYSEAMKIVALEHPALAAEYAHGQGA